MNASIETVPVNHNGTCFFTGEKVGGKPAAVALIKQGDKVLVAMPVSKLYLRWQQSGTEQEFKEWDKERRARAAEVTAKRLETQSKNK